MIQNNNSSNAIRLFFIYFLLYFLTYVGLGYIQLFLVDESNLDAKFYLFLAYISLNCLILLFIVLWAQKTYNLISKDQFKLEINPLFAAILLGLGLGIILPMLTNFPYFFAEGNYAKTIVDEGLKGLGEYFLAHTFYELLINALFGTLLFSVLKELFFRGVLFQLYTKSASINIATIQVSLFYVMINQLFQFNQLDFISIFIASIILSFLFFKTGSLLPGIFFSIAYDIPIYLYSWQEDFSKNAVKYLTYNQDFIAIYGLAIAAVYLGFFLINSKKIKAS